MGYTLETTAMRSLGLTSAAAMAARRPAPPPPTRSTSCEETSMVPTSRQVGSRTNRGRVRHIVLPNPDGRNRSNPAPRPALPVRLVWHEDRSDRLLGNVVSHELDLMLSVSSAEAIVRASAICQ